MRKGQSSDLEVEQSRLLRRLMLVPFFSGARQILLLQLMETTAEERGSAESVEGRVSRKER